MEIRRLEDGTVVLARLDSFCCDLLHQIVSSAQIDDPAVHDRLFSSPTAGKEPQFDDEWVRYVEPELRDLFRSAADVVTADLGELSRKGVRGSRTVRIPGAHLEPWIHVLNQARLALAARHGFDEDDMQRLVPSGEDARGLALLQVHFYGLLIECFLGELE